MYRKKPKTFMTFRVTLEEARHIQEMADKWTGGNKSVFLREIARSIKVKRLRKIHGIEIIGLYGKVANIIPE